MINYLFLRVAKSAIPKNKNSGDCDVISKSKLRESAITIVLFPVLRERQGPHTRSPSLFLFLSWRTTRGSSTTQRNYS